MLLSSRLHSSLHWICSVFNMPLKWITNISYKVHSIISAIFESISLSGLVPQESHNITGFMIQLHTKDHLVHALNTLSLAVYFDFHLHKFLWSPSLKWLLFLLASSFVEHEKCSPTPPICTSPPSPVNKSSWWCGQGLILSLDVTPSSS